MADSTATLPQASAQPAPEVESEAEEAVATERRWSAIAVVIWLLFAVGLVVFITVARVPIAAGWREGRSMRVLDIWSLVALELAQVAGPLVTPALATALVLVILGGSLLCLWLAMSVTNDDTVERPD
jgi:hypothetical protein